MRLASGRSMACCCAPVFLEVMPRRGLFNYLMHLAGLNGIQRDFTGFKGIATEVTDKRSLMAPGQGSSGRYNIRESAEVTSCSVYLYSF